MIPAYNTHPTTPTSNDTASALNQLDDRIDAGAVDAPIGHDETCDYCGEQPGNVHINWCDRETLVWSDVDSCHDCALDNLTRWILPSVADRGIVDVEVRPVADPVAAVAA